MWKEVTAWEHVQRKCSLCHVAPWKKLGTTHLRIIRASQGCERARHRLASGVHVVLAHRKVGPYARHEQRHRLRIVEYLPWRPVQPLQLREDLRVRQAVHRAVGTGKLRGAMPGHDEVDRTGNVGIVEPASQLEADERPHAVPEECIRGHQARAGASPTPSPTAAGVSSPDRARHRAAQREHRRPRTRCSRRTSAGSWLAQASMNGHDPAPANGKQYMRRRASELGRRHVNSPLFTCGAECSRVRGLADETYSTGSSYCMIAKTLPSRS